MTRAAKRIQAGRKRYGPDLERAEGIGSASGPGQGVTTVTST